MSATYSGIRPAGTCRAEGLTGSTGTALTPAGWSSGSPMADPSGPARPRQQSPLPALHKRTTCFNHHRPQALPKQARGRNARTIDVSRRAGPKPRALSQLIPLLTPMAGPAARWKRWWWTAALGPPLEELLDPWAQTDWAQVDSRLERHGEDHHSPCGGFWDGLCEADIIAKPSVRTACWCAIRPDVDQ
jgi:hypothetical protein